MTTKVHPSLRDRPGLDVQVGSPLSRDLGDLARRHGLMGAVLITFADDRVGVDSFGKGVVFAEAMNRLGDQMLAAIDDGKFDPDPVLVDSTLNKGGTA